MASDSTYLMAAGDIASTASASGGAAKSGRILDVWFNDTVHLPLSILTLGDAAYTDGLLSEFNNYFDPFWGAGSTQSGYTWENKKSIIKPVTGNHEWNNNLAGYNSYFGAGVTADANRWRWRLEPVSADGQKHWRILGLDSEVDANAAAASNWLRAELDASMTAGPGGTRQNIICAWHHPMWTVGGYSPGINKMANFHRILQDSKYDGVLRIVLNGHDHLYVRYNPLLVSGTNTQVPASLTAGVVEILAGMGGHSPDSVAGGANMTNVAFSYGGTPATGIIRAELRANQFICEYVRSAIAMPSGVVEDSFTLSRGSTPPPPPVIGEAQFTVINDTLIRAIVPADAVDGIIKVKVGTTTYRSTQTFDVGAVVVGAPVINDASPRSGPTGTSVEIIGAGFTGVTGASRVQFPGATPGTFVNAASYVVNSDDLITAVTPAGVGTGPIKVTHPTNGATNSPFNFQGTTVTGTTFAAVSIDPPRQRLSGVAGGAGGDREYTATVTADVSQSVYTGAAVFTIDWGDGTTSQITAPTLTVAHTYRYNHVNAYKHGWGGKLVDVTVTDANGTDRTTAKVLLQRDHILSGLANGGV